jgi:hypothetical protein
MVEKAPHRKLKIEQHESRLNRGELGCTTSWSIILPALTPQVTPFHLKPLITSITRS